MYTIVDGLDYGGSFGDDKDGAPFLVFTQSQETQKTIDIAAILVSQSKEIIIILLLRVHQHGRHDVRWKPAIDVESEGSNKEGSIQVWG